MQPPPFHVREPGRTTAARAAVGPVPPAPRAWRVDSESMGLARCCPSVTPQSPNPPFRPSLHGRAAALRASTASQQRLAAARYNPALRVTAAPRQHRTRAHAHTIASLSAQCRQVYCLKMAPSALSTRRPRPPRHWGEFDGSRPRICPCPAGHCTRPGLSLREPPQKTT